MHAVEVLDRHVVRHRRRLEVGLAAAREVQDLPAGVDDVGGRGDDRAVERAGALRAAGHEQRGPVGVEAELGDGVVAQPSAVEPRDLRPQRHADELAAQPRRPVGQPDERRPAGAEHVRHARLRVRLVDRDRHALEARGPVGGRGGVAAEADDDVDAALADERADLAHGAAPAAGEPQRGDVRTPREGQLLDRDELEARARHELALEPLRGAEHRELGLGMALPQPLRGREQRVDVSGGPAAGEQHTHVRPPRPGAPRPSPSGCRPARARGRRR